MGNYLDKNSRSLRRHERRPSYTHAATPGVTQARRSRVFYCERCSADLVLGALSSSPVHRALVLVLGTNIAVLLGGSKSSRQSVCDLYYLLYLIPDGGRVGGRGIVGPLDLIPWRLAVQG